eukprot:TRINITY_DN20009_c0_g1_i1.p1 TRINITY_DN20009_c0_g1~~TRINITY_DN20009_c0_g1_i1.p1  ORF type:complete len:303 (-),score=51.60 TRINITY_DN20009_c0_g1_i1:794-1702(-)
MRSMRLAMWSLSLMLVLLAAGTVQLNAHNVYYAATLKSGNTTVGSLTAVTNHTGDAGWLYYTITATPNITVSSVSINDEGEDGEVVLNITKSVDLKGLGASGMTTGMYQDLATEIRHLSHLPGGHVIKLLTSSGAIVGEIYHVLDAYPGVYAVALMDTGNKTVGNSTLTLADNTNSTSNASLAIVFYPPTSLKGALKFVTVEEENGEVLHDWTSYVNLTDLNLYGEASAKFLLPLEDAEHIRDGGHYLRVKTASGDSARGSFDLPLAAVPSPKAAPAPSSAFALPSPIIIVTVIAMLLSLAL